MRPGQTHRSAPAEICHPGEQFDVANGLAGAISTAKGVNLGFNHPVLIRVRAVLAP